jgi:drug/metabolite transporter (DMT)-like permease
VPIYLTLSFASLVFFSASVIVFKLTAKHAMPNPYAYFFYYFLIYFFLGLFLPVFRPIEVIPENVSHLLPVLPYAVTIYVGMLCFSLAIYRLDVTTISPLINFKNVFTPILATLFLN